MDNKLNKKVVKATKWSALTEIAAKLVAPISTMLLARLLTPDAFGIMVTATMVISFAEIFTDAGFQKYLVQHNFEDKNALYLSTNVAFISNLSISIIAWIVICTFSSRIASIVGSEGYGMVISISSICIPLTAFSSIQMAIYKRHLDFKTLFIVRMVGVSIPIIITIPLAIIFRSYWALIIGMIALNLSNAIILSIKSEWKPKLWYNWLLFKEMFSFSSWSMIEAIALWATSYIDIFIIGRLLNDYYLGLYRTSMNTVGQFTSVITAAITPVLFSTISRLQNNSSEFNITFLKFQKVISIIIVPLGAILYIYRNLVTELLLGSKWQEAAYFIGLWALTTSVTVILANISGEVYRAKGKPMISVIVQLSHIAFIVPIVLITIPYGFTVLCEWRAIVRLELIIANLIAIYYMINISPYRQFKNVFPSVFASTVIILLSFIFPISRNYLYASSQLILSILIYLGIILSFQKEKSIIINFKNIIQKK